MLIKLEWLGYRVVKRLWRYVKPFSSDTGMSQTDRWTDRQTDLLYQHRASAPWRAIKIPDISLRAVKFPDISRFFKQVVTLFVACMQCNLLHAPPCDMTVIRAWHATMAHVKATRTYQTSLFLMVWWCGWRLWHHQVQRQWPPASRTDTARSSASLAPTSGLPNLYITRDEIFRCIIK